MQFSVHGPDEPSFTAEDGIRHLSRADAVAEVERCSFTTNEGRMITHCVSQRGIGADWNTPDAVEATKNSVDRAWIDHALWGECLGIINEDGQILYFDQVTPA
jgi:hypothetical protein